MSYNPNNSVSSLYVLDNLIISGPAVVGNNLLAPGTRVARAVVISSAHLVAGTAPTGSGLTATVSRGGNTLLTISLSASQTTANLTGLGLSLQAGDILNFNITAIGSAGPGADIYMQLIGS